MVSDGVEMVWTSYGRQNPHAKLETGNWKLETGNSENSSNWNLETG